MTVDEMFGEDDVPPEFKKMLDMHKEHFAPEELHPDLAATIQTSGVFPMVHHPLIVSMAVPHNNKMLNRGYEQKKKAVEEAVAEGNWPKFIWMHERPYRFDALVEAAAKGLAKDPKKFWDMVGNVWTDSENIHQNQKKWEKLWTAPMPHREECMNEEERAAMAALPEVITVYRGVGHARFKNGLSWTTDKARAIWFAKRFAGSGGRKPFVYEGKVAKQDVLAHFLGRHESEIVCLPRNVKDIRQL